MSEPERPRYFRLRKLKIVRVGAVDRGANQAADVLLFKRAEPVTEADIAKQSPPHPEPDGDEAAPRDYASHVRQHDLWQSLYTKWDAFCCTFHDILGDMDEDNVPHLPLLVRSIEQFQTDVSDLLTRTGVMSKAAPLFDTLLAVSKAEGDAAAQLPRLHEAMTALQALVDEACPPDIQKGARVADPKVTDGDAMTALDAMRKRAESAEADLKKALATVEELSGKVTTLEQTVATTETALAKARQTPEQQEEEYLASLPDAVRKRYEAQQLETAALKKQLKDAEDRAEQTEYIQKTASFRTFGLTPDHWQVLKAIDAMPEEPRTELLRLMKAATEREKTSSLYKAAAPDSAAGATVGSSAEEQLMALAKAHQSEKGGELYEALHAVAQSHGELYQRYILEKRVRNAGNVSDRGE